MAPNDGDQDIGTVTDMAKGMWDAIEGIGRAPTQNEALKTLTNRRDSIRAQVSNSEATGYNRSNGKLDEWRKELGVLNAQINAFTLMGDIQVAKEEAASSARAQHNQNLTDAISLQQGLNQGLTNAEKREKATGMKYGASSSGTAGVNVQTTVNVNTGGDQQQLASQNAALTKAYQQTVDRAVTDGIQKQTRQGGIIWLAMQTR